MTHHEHVPDFRSRLVTILKVGLPLVALGMLSALFLIQTDDTLSGGGISFTRGDMDALGEGLSVSNPVLTGTSEAEDRFRFTADRVVPDAAPPTRADMTNVAGRIDLDRGASIDLSAPTAAFDLPTQRLVLGGPVHITTSDGYDMRAREMRIDLAKGVLEASQSVKSQGPLGSITSGDLRIKPNAPGDDGARLFSFGKGVRVLYVPTAAAPK